MPDFDWTQIASEVIPERQPIPTVQAGGGTGMPIPPTFAAQAQQMPPELARSIRPPVDDVELKQRESMWTAIANKFMTDPNLQRALGMTGAAMAQPIAPGQSKQGHLANSFLTGTNAYETGRAANLAQEKSVRGEVREDTKLQDQLRTSQVTRDSTVAGTKRTEAGTPGVEAASRVAVATEKNHIKQVQLDADRAELLLSQGKEDEAVKVLQRAKQVSDLFRQKYVDEQTPLSEDVRAAQARVNDLVAKAGLTGSQGKKVDAETKKIEAEVAAEAALTPEQRLAKAQGGSISAEVQRKEMWRQSYRKTKAENPSSPDIQGLTEEEYSTKMTREAKKQDNRLLLATLLRSGMNDQDPVIVDLKKDIAGEIATRAGATPGVPKYVRGKDGKLHLEGATPVKGK